VKVKWLILAIAAAGACIGIYFAATYKSEVQLLFELDDAALRGDLEEVKEIYSQLDGAKVVTPSGESILHTAAGKGHIEVVEFFLENGVEIDLRDDRGQTALHRSVRTSQPEMVKYLLARGADRNIKDNDGRTAYDWAIAVYEPQIADLLSDDESK
jgi:ankyrin repeat protein